MPGSGQHNDRRKMNVCHSTNSHRRCANVSRPAQQTRPQVSKREANKNFRDKYHVMFFDCLSMAPKPAGTRVSSPFVLQSQEKTQSSDREIVFANWRFQMGGRSWMGLLELAVPDKSTEIGEMKCDRRRTIYCGFTTIST
jgi:hypothetical protein